MPCACVPSDGRFSRRIVAKSGRSIVAAILILIPVLCQASAKALEVSDPSFGEQTGRRSLLNSDGTASLAEVPDSEKRPFKIASYYQFRDGEREDVIAYVEETIVPTVSSLLGRWVRVRAQPTCNPA